LATPLTLDAIIQTIPNKASMVIGTYRCIPQSLDAAAGAAERPYAPRVSDTAPSAEDPARTLVSDFRTASSGMKIGGTIGGRLHGWTVPAARITSTLALTAKHSAAFQPAPTSPTRRTGPAIQSACR
jgi:hypothetical protein